ncbi:hypothetical protein G9A89_009830 [Geosiphon pyriformis]|nr:hypothetical protein G9A89_009830 [Geosiphon pyriformis]
MHPQTLQDAVTNARDFESAELEASYAQAINLVMNESSELDSKLKQFRPRQWNLGTGYFQNLNAQQYLSLLVTSEDASPNNWEPNQQQPLTSNIPSATITNDEFLAAIFLFKLEKLIPTPLFSGAALEEKPITAMYTNAKIDGHFIKLILDSRSAGSIITRQFMNQLGRRVD